MIKIFVQIIILVTLMGCKFRGKSIVNSSNTSEESNSSVLFLDTIHFNKILKEDFSFYYGKPIESIMHNELVEKYTKIRIIEEPSHCFRYLLLIFSYKKNTLLIQIHLDTYNLHFIKQCKDPSEGNLNWDMELIKKELLSKVVVFYL
jgi:hypothetical protein